MSKAKRWKPKEGEIYYWADGTCTTCSWLWAGVTVDKELFRLGNCFKTKKEADAVARKLKGFWKDVREGQG